MHHLLLSEWLYYRSVLPLPLSLPHSLFHCLPSAQGMAVVLENPLSHPVMVNLLPLLHFHLHDVSEKVRLAMLDLLLVVKELRTIKVDVGRQACFLVSMLLLICAVLACVPSG